jgi:hypothetical protein
LENISQALRELPDQRLVSLLQHLRVLYAKQAGKQKAKTARVLPPPPRDPRRMERSELQAYLRNGKYFPYKADLLTFARQYEVPVNARTPREEIIRLCLRMIHDIPRGFTVLRFLAEQHETVSPTSARSVLH